MQRTLRTLNVNFLNGSAFRGLGAEPLLSYDEVSPNTGAAALLEGDCDLALIPIAEFFIAGKYQALPFGIVAKGKVESVYLFADVALEEIKYIRVDARSRTSVLLLKLLLHRRNLLNVTFERSESGDIARQIGGTTGGLIIGDLALGMRRNFRYAYDLAELWFAEFKLPFVFAIWAVRRDSVAADQIEMLKHAFESSIPKREYYAREWAERHQMNREDAVTYVQDLIHLDLDRAAYDGALKFWSEGVAAGFFPHATRPLELLWGEQSESSSAAASPLFDLESVAARAARSARVSLAEMEILSAESKLSDLGLIAATASSLHRRETLRTGEVTTTLRLTNVCEYRHKFLDQFVPPGHSNQMYLNFEEFEAALDLLPRTQPLRLALMTGISPEISLDLMERLFSAAKSRANVTLCCLSPEELVRFSKQENIPLSQVIARCVSSGLDILGAPVAPLLLNRHRPKSQGTWLTCDEWIALHRTCHRNGLPSMAHLTLFAKDREVDRLIHLSKIRALQDETSGFIGLSIEGLSEGAASPATTLFRTQALSRIYLDNIPSIEVSGQQCGTPFTEVLLQFGADLLSAPASVSVELSR